MPYKLWHDSFYQWGFAAFEGKMVFLWNADRGWIPGMLNQKTFGWKYEGRTLRVKAYLAHIRTEPRAGK